MRATTLHAAIRPVSDCRHAKSLTNSSNNRGLQTSSPFWRSLAAARAERALLCLWPNRVRLSSLVLLAAFYGGAGAGFAGQPAPEAITAERPQSETLRYQVNWPSGLSLGEAQMQSLLEGSGSKLELSLSAGIPGFQVEDKFTSVINGTLCSQEFRKETQHGGRKGTEVTTFTASEGGAKAVRKTMPGGGTTELPAPACSRDALAYLYLVRAELQKGRILPAQTIFFGAQYEIRLQFQGTKQVKIAEAPMEADQLHATVRGPKSLVEFDVYFSRDAKRIPVLFRVPFVLGTFSMEWIP